MKKLTSTENSFPSILFSYISTIFSQSSSLIISLWSSDNSFSVIKQELVTVIYKTEHLISEINCLTKSMFIFVFYIICIHCIFLQKRWITFYYIWHIIFQYNQLIFKRENCKCSLITVKMSATTFLCICWFICLCKVDL